MYHPRRDGHGNLIKLHNPSEPTPLSTWTDATELACVVPDGPMPPELNSVRFERWRSAPTHRDGWEALAQAMPLQVEEPPFHPPPGLEKLDKSAGVVVREPDGRIWFVAPSNAYGGYQATFPKGRLEGKSTKATALVETFEESGLQVRLIAFLIDVPKTETYTRYFLAERISGNPADMGWESQAVMLAPLAMLPEKINHTNDLSILKALLDQLVGLNKGTQTTTDNINR